MTVGEKPWGEVKASPWKEPPQKKGVNDPVQDQKGGGEGAPAAGEEKPSFCRKKRKGCGLTSGEEKKRNAARCF